MRPIPPCVARNSSGSCVSLDLELAPVGEREAQRAEVGAERAGGVVVLAVDVGRHHAAERHVTGARHDRHREAAGRAASPTRRASESPASARSTPALGIEGEQPVGAPARRHARARVRRKRSVAIRAPETAREPRARTAERRSSSSTSSASRTGTRPQPDTITGTPRFMRAAAR